MVKFLACAVLATIAVFAGSTGAQESSAETSNYRSEIMTHVFEPCWRVSIRRTGLDKQMDEEQALAVMRILQKEQVEAGMSALLPLVSGKEWAARELLYTVSLDACLEGIERAK